MVSRGAVCFWMEAWAQRSVVCGCVVRGVCVACVWVVCILVHYRSELSLCLVRLAGVDARRGGATSGCSRESASIFFVLLHQRAAGVFDSSVCTGSRVAQAQAFSDAVAVVGCVLCQRAAVFQLQHHC